MRPLPKVRPRIGACYEESSSEDQNQGSAEEGEALGKESIQEGCPTVEAEESEGRPSGIQQGR